MADNSHPLLRCPGESLKIDICSCSDPALAEGGEEALTEESQRPRCMANKQHVCSSHVMALTCCQTLECILPWRRCSSSIALFILAEPADYRVAARVIKQAAHSIWGEGSPWRITSAALTQAEALAHNAANWLKRNVKCPNPSPFANLKLPARPAKEGAQDDPSAPPPPLSVPSTSLSEAGQPASSALFTRSPLLQKTDYPVTKAVSRCNKLTRQRSPVRQKERRKIKEEKKKQAWQRKR